MTSITGCEKCRTKIRKPDKREEWSCSSSPSRKARSTSTRRINTTSAIGMSGHRKGECLGGVLTLKKNDKANTKLTGFKLAISADTYLTTKKMSGSSWGRFDQKQLQSECLGAIMCAVSLLMDSKVCHFKM